MLKGIDPLLTPDLLHVLASMGHGDEIVIADANFTAASLGAGKPVITLAGVGVARACARAAAARAGCGSTTNAWCCSRCGCTARCRGPTSRGSRA